jgi:AcrR family transcriptional regulator
MRHQQSLGREALGVTMGERARSTGPERARGRTVDPRRERIVAAALALLAEGGVAGLTTRAIGERVGLHNSSLFHHFRGKREIVSAVLARINEDLVTRFAPLAADREPRLETLVAVALDVSDHYAANRAEARCALRLLLDPGDLDDAGDGRFTTVLWSWLARAQAAGAIRPVSVSHAARSLLGILLLEPTWPARADAGPRDDARRRSELVAFVRGALAPGGEASDS